MSEQKAPEKSSQKPHKMTVGLVKYLSGADMLASFVLGLWQNLKSCIGLLLPLFVGVRGLFSKRKLDEDFGPNAHERNSLDDKARFSFDMKKYNVSNDEIKRRVEISWIRSMFYLFVLLISIFLTRISFYSGNIMLVLCSIVFSVFGFVSLSYWAFANYRLRHKAFYPFRKWAALPREWMPSRKMVANVFAFFLILGLAGGGLSGARADDLSSSSGLFSNKEANCNVDDNIGGIAEYNPADVFLLPCKKDIARNLLENIFPGIGPLSDTPDIGGTNFTNGKSGLSQAFHVYLSILMGIGTCGILWHVVNTIVSGAHEGDLIKSKWGGPWSPIKVSIGYGSIVPMYKNYSLVNILCVYLVLWSFTMANSIWMYYIKGLTDPNYHGTPVIGTSDKVAKIVPAALCWSVHHNYQDNDTFPDTAEHQPWVASDSVVQSYSTTRLNRESDATIMNGVRSLRDAVSGLFISNDSSSASGKLIVTTWDFGESCGRFSITRNEANPSDDNQVNKTLEKMGITSKNIISSYIKELLTGNGGVITTVISSTNFKSDFSEPKNSFPNIAKAVLGSSKTSSLNTSDVSPAIMNIASSAKRHLDDAWLSVMQETINAIQDGSGSSEGNGQNNYATNFRRHAGEYGWAMAGSFYMNLARMQNMVQNELSSNGKLVSGDFQSSSRPGFSSEQTDADLVRTPAYGSLVETFNGASHDYLNSINEAKLNSINTSTVENDLTQDAKNVGNVAGVTIDINTIGLDNPDSLIGGAIDKVSNAVGEVLSYFIDMATGIKNDGGGNKLQAMIEFGHNLITIYFIIQTGLFLGKVLSWGGKVAGKTASLAGPEGKAAGVLMEAVGDGLGKFASYLMTIMNILLLVGVMHAYVLPMIPYIYFEGFVLSEMILIVTSMIAAPLWMMMHIRLDGGDDFVGNHQASGYSILINLFLRAPLGILAYVMSFMIFNAMVVFMSMTFYPAIQGGQGHGGPGIIGMIVNLILMTFLHWQIALRCFNLVNTVPNSISQWMGLHQQMSDHESGSLLAAVAAGMSTHLRQGQEVMNAGKTAASSKEDKGAKKQGKGKGEGDGE